jgi:hypothetical protein
VHLLRLSIEIEIGRVEASRGWGRLRVESVDRVAARVRVPIQWDPMGSNGIQWIECMTRGSQTRPLSALCGRFQWIPLDPIGYHWIPLDTIGYHWLPLARLLALFLSKQCSVPFLLPCASLSNYVLWEPRTTWDKSLPREFYRNENKLSLVRHAEKLRMAFAWMGLAANFNFLRQGLDTVRTIYALWLT